MFELAIDMSEFRVSTDDALARARQIGATQIYIAGVQNGEDAPLPVTAMTDAQADDLARRVAAHELRIVELNSGTFKQVHLCELELGAVDEHPQYAEQLRNLERALQVAQRLDVPAVTCFAFAWPGEYGPGAKSTWPMRWATRGGLISNTDIDKLEQAFAPILALAERYEVDLRVMQMAWNYTNTSGNFRCIAERLGSPPRLRLKWCPADGLNSGELDVATAGLRNVLPYVSSIHIKDLAVHDGPNNGFRYELVGDGQVAYGQILSGLVAAGCYPLLSVASHVGGGTLDGNDPEKTTDWLRRNYQTVTRLAEAAVDARA